MKCFAVKPVDFSADDIIDYRQSLVRSGVDYLYLRGLIDKDDLYSVIKAFGSTEIRLIISHQLASEIEAYTCGIHYKNSEIGLINKVQSEKALLTAAAHDYDTARRLFESGVDYVFVSPVFKPFSKLNDNRELFPREKIRKLTEDFGVRVILLGGLNNDRIDQLKKYIKNDFSVAGISMFFG